ncbi:transglycosylase SLT domain-containing protein [Roseovarius sp. S4756]|uniref:transglycosylase SLT domain-containing protein n=1 Tax=Roseovarius maritimus TaxID=3342637 RepID=UPI003B675D1D
MTLSKRLSRVTCAGKKVALRLHAVVLGIPYCSSVISILISIHSSPSFAVNTSEICDRAAQSASRRTGVPLDVLRAITRSETGRTVAGELQPWPWTVNMEGVGKWFSTRTDALNYVFSNHGKGARSFDVGCFQVNYRWHGQNFNSINHMFDPEENALYAAGFLKRLQDEMGDWSKAAGAYHSRTPAHATGYRARFDEVLASLPNPGPMNAVIRPRLKDSEADSTTNQPQPSRRNPYPFLKVAKVETRFGSLVPLAAAGTGGHLFAEMEALK